MHVYLEYWSIWPPVVLHDKVFPLDDEKEEEDCYVKRNKDMSIDKYAFIKLNLNVPKHYSNVKNRIEW